jgi:hypothetical protein
MKQLAGVLFIYKKEKDLEVWLGKRLRPPFQGSRSIPAVEMTPTQTSWEAVNQIVREELNVVPEQWLQHRKAIKISPFKYKIPFLYQFEIFAVMIREKAMIDEQPHFTGHYEAQGWHPVNELPPKTHLSIHYAMGLIDSEKLSLQPDFFTDSDG